MDAQSVVPARSAIEADTVQRVLILLSGLCTVALSVWLLVQSPTQQYEVMANAYHPVFWALLSTGLGAAAVVVLISSTRDDSYWKLALLFICVIYGLYNGLPLFRGWAMYGRGSSDALAHIGEVRVILESGSYDDGNLYPAVHVLTSVFRFIGFELRSINMLLSATFTVVYLSGMYILSNRLLEQRRAALAVLFVATIPLYGKFQHTFHPVIFSFMLTPYYVYVFDRYRSTDHRSYAVVAVFLSAVLVFFHPTSSLYAIVMLLVTVTAQLCYRLYSGVTISPTKGSGIIAFAGICWAGWYSQFPWVRERLMIALGFIEKGGQTVAQDYGTEEVSRAPTIQDIIVPLINRYGAIILVCGLALLGAVVVVSRLRARRGSVGETWLTGQYLVGVGISFATIVTFTSALAFNPTRNMRYMIMMATLLCGLFVYWVVTSEWESESTYRRAGAVVVVVLLLVSFPLTITKTYHPHTHLTYSEADGTNWLYEHHEGDTEAVSHEVSEKMRQYDPAGEHSDLVFENIGGESTIPRYFGYRTNETLRRTVDGERTYLVTKQYDTEYRWALKEFLQAENEMYTEANVRQLNRDRTVSRPYTNGEYSVWYVNGR